MSDLENMRHAEDQLIIYAEWAKARDRLVRWALDAGLGPARISELTGIARTTISRIADRAGNAESPARADATSQGD